MEDSPPGRSENIFRLPRPPSPRHLSVLKEADLIRDTREGKYIYYELNASVLEEIMLWISDLKGASEHEGNDHEK